MGEMRLIFINYSLNWIVNFLIVKGFIERPMYKEIEGLGQIETCLTDKFWDFV